MVDGQIEPDEECAITEEKFLELQRHELLPGDIVMARRGELGRAAMVTEAAEGWLCGTGSLRVRLDKSKADPRFVFWAMRTRQVSDWLSLESVGTTMENMSGESLSGLPIMLPPLPTQRAIAGYLDRETKRLDELVRAKEGLLELVAEKRRALITRAVTRGLNPKSPLRDSGIPWLGLIPAHWSPMQLKHACHSIKTGGTPSPAYMEHQQGESVLWYTPSDFSDELRLGDSRRKLTQEAINAEEAPLFMPGTVYVVGIGATLGKVGYSPTAASANQQVNALTLRENSDCAFIAALLWSKADFLRDSANSATLPILNQQRMGEIPIALPPLDEQRAIVAHIATETAKLDALRASAERTIRLLKERRSALISAAVTGKIAISEPSA
jgi:type I restriction enzyme, S subunit